jgi:hypothetical protein
MDPAATPAGPIVTVLSVARAVTIAVAIVGLGASELDPAVAPSPPSSPPIRPNLQAARVALGRQRAGRRPDPDARYRHAGAAGDRGRHAAGGGVGVVRERLRELGVLHALGCTTAQLAAASAGAKAAWARSALIGVPLGLSFHLLFKAASCDITGFPPPLGIALVALAAVAIAAAAGAVPALLAGRVPDGVALAAE